LISISWTWRENAPSSPKTTTNSSKDWCRIISWWSFQSLICKRGIACQGLRSSTPTSKSCKTSRLAMTRLKSRRNTLRRNRILLGRQSASLKMVDSSQLRKWKGKQLQLMMMRRSQPRCRELKQVRVVMLQTRKVLLISMGWLMISPWIELETKCLLRVASYLTKLNWQEWNIRQIMQTVKKTASSKKFSIKCALHRLPHPKLISLIVNHECTQINQLLIRRDHEAQNQLAESSWRIKLLTKSKFNAGD